MKRKLMCLLLTVCMVISLCPTMAVTVWAEGVATFKLIYDGNGNTGGDAPREESCTFDSEECGFTVSANTGNLVREGFSFDGWNTEPDGEGEAYAPGSTITLYCDYDQTTEVTLYAQWEENAGGKVCSVTRGETTTEYPSVAKALEEEQTESAEAPTVIKMIADDAENFEIPEGRFIILDLCGHVLASTESEQTSTPIITNYGTLTLRDSDAAAESHTTHYFVVNEDNRWILTDSTDNAKDISELTARPVEGDIISVNGGVITGSLAGAGAVTNCGAVLTVESGSFIGNVVAFHNADSGDAREQNVLIVKSGTIAGNISLGSGAGIISEDKLVVEGGRIVFNTADGDGAGISASDDLTVSGNTEIGYNEAETGTGISVSACNATISGSVRITHNRAVDENRPGDCIGGGVAVTFGSTLTVRDSVVISDNSTDGVGGGIGITAQGMMDADYEACHAYILGGTVSGNHADGEGGGIFTGKDCTLELGSVTVTGNTSDTNGGGVSISGEVGGCFIEGTKITMADGSVKNIEDVKNGELIRTFDHETGSVSFEKVCEKFTGEGTGTAFTLRFSDGIELSIVGCHGLFEKESGKYVLVDEDNASSLVGHHFYNADGDCWEELLSVSVSSERHSFHALYSEHHINAVANHMLSVTDDVLFRVNVFELDADMKVDAAKKQRDIETYGLTSYEDFSEYTDEAEFYRFNNQYDHIAVCKGLTTAEEIIGLAVAKMSAENTGETVTETAAPLMTMNTAAKAAEPLMARNAEPVIEVGGAQKAPLTLCSGAGITGNTVDDKPNNVYLAEGKYICIDGDTPENISAGITTEITPDSESGVPIVSKALTAYTGFFTADDEQYIVKFNNNATTEKTTDDYLELAVAPPHTHDMGTEETSDDVTYEKRITTGEELTELFTDGGSGCLAADIVLSETAALAEEVTVNLCLNGHTLTTEAGVNGSIIRVSLNSKLFLTDCGTTVRYFTDENGDGAFETVHDKSFDISGKTPGKDYIKTEGGVLYGGSAVSGGAIITNGYTELTVDGISLVGNSAETSGGAIDATSVTVKDCVIEGNLSAGTGGAVCCYDLSITDSKLSYNTAGKEGGAVYSTAPSDTTISGTEFIGNRVVNETETTDAQASRASGGALSVYYKPTTLTNCKICDNYVYSKSGDAQFAAMNTGALTMKGSEVSGNTTEGKTALGIIQSDTARIENSTISGNKLTGSDSADALIIFRNDSVIKSSRITDNTAVCSGDAVASAGLKVPDYSGKTLSLADDMVFSGNTLCDIRNIAPIDLSELTSVTDADGKAAKIAYYYNGSIIEGFDLAVTTVTEEEPSSCFTPVNPEAYFVSKTAVGGYQFHLVSRILEQPGKDNGYTFKLYTGDLRATDVTYQWNMLNGSYLTEKDNVITLADKCSWDDTLVNGFFTKGGWMVSITTDEAFLYVYSVDGGSVSFMSGTAEEVTGHPGVYKVTPYNKEIRVKAGKVRFSKTLVTESAVAGSTSAALSSTKSGEYRCAATVKGKEIKSNYVRVDHVHAWTYTVSRSVAALDYYDTVTAACTDDCTAKDLTLILAASDVTYDGDTHGALRLAAKGDTKEAASFCGSTALPTVTYENKNGSSWEPMTTAPKAAGTYRASITVGEGTAARTACVEYTVSKAVPTVNAAPTASAITYGKTLADSTLTGGEASAAGSFAWKTGTTAPAVSDSNTTAYKVVFTPTDTVNYSTVECDVKLTVTKAADNALTGTLSCPDVNEGKTPAPTGVTAKYGTVKYVYSADNGTTWSDWDKTNGVGEYQVKAIVVGTDDYNEAESTPVTFNVKAADKLTMTVSGDAAARHTDVKTYTVSFGGKRPCCTTVVWDITGGRYEYVGGHIGTDTVTIICEDVGTLHIHATLVDHCGRPVRDSDGKIVEGSLNVKVQAKPGNIINMITVTVKTVVKTVSKWFGR